MTEKISNVLISTNRFILKPLTINDATDRYVDWLNEPSTNQFISAKLTQTDLQNYIAERLNREDVLFLGIFSKKDGLHIGNIKYEPVDSLYNYAIMGILIGDPCWRGKGVAGEVIFASASWLYEKHNIREIILGVSRANTSAIRAYQKIGFIEKPTKFIPIKTAEKITMIWYLNGLKNESFR